MVLAMKALVVLYKVSSHLISLFKVWLILDFFQDLMYWLSEHRANHLSSSRSTFSSKISLRPVTVVSIQPKILSILRDHLSLPLTLLLVFLDLLILVNTVHEPTYTPSRLPDQ